MSNAHFVLCAFPGCDWRMDVFDTSVDLMAIVRAHEGTHMREWLEPFKVTSAEPMRIERNCLFGFPVIEADFIPKTDGPPIVLGGFDWYIDGLRPDNVARMGLARLLNEGSE